MKFIPVCEPLLEGNELKYIQDCIETGWISSTGKYVNEFESSFAKYCGVKFGIGVTNGTVALHLALIAAGIKTGDEVIIPSFTMAATAFAIAYIGAIPIIVDVDPETWNINYDEIEINITKKTKAILTVSIFGNPCDYNRLNEIKNKYNLIIIEDAAESHGASFNDIKTGALADITTFSFFANKNLTTGEGGMVLTNDENLFSNCKYFKNLCFSLTEPRNYFHQDIGFNYRLSNLHAAIGLAQVEKADYYIKRRIENYNLYKKYLSIIDGIQFQKTTIGGKSSHWMNPIVFDPRIYPNKRDNIVELLKQANIDSRILFKGMHIQPPLKKYLRFSKTKKFKNTEYLSANGLYLPSGSNLTEQEIIYISSKLLEIIKNDI